MSLNSTNVDITGHFNTYSDIRIVNPTSKDEKGDYFFISYKSDDKDKVLLEIVSKLQREYGLRVYFDSAFEGDNKNWITQMDQAMENTRCKGVIAFISPRYTCSYATLIEILNTTSIIVKAKHQDRELEIIPFMFQGMNLEDCVNEHLNDKTPVKIETLELERLKVLIDDLDDKYLVTKNFFKRNIYQALTVDYIALMLKSFLKKNGDGLNELNGYKNLDNLVSRIRNITLQAFDEDLIVKETHAKSSHIQELENQKESKVQTIEPSRKFHSKSSDEDAFNLENVKLQLEKNEITARALLNLIKKRTSNSENTLSKQRNIFDNVARELEMLIKGIATNEVYTSNNEIRKKLDGYVTKHHNLSKQFITWSDEFIEKDDDSGASTCLQSFTQMIENIEDILKVLVELKEQ